MEMYNKNRLYKQKQNLSSTDIESGQSILEVVIALALISIVLITLVSMAALSIRAAVFSRNQTQATRLTQQVAEWLRGEKDAGWINFKGHTGTTNWCFDTLTWNKGRTCNTSDTVSGTTFLRSVNFINNADGSVEADIQTAWTDAQGTHSSPTSIIFTNWK